MNDTPERPTSLCPECEGIRVDSFGATCQRCGGTGRVSTMESIALSILLHLERLAAQNLQVHRASPVETWTEESAREALESEGPLQGTQWEHAKTENVYRIVACGLREATLEPVVIYESEETGDVWVRPLREWRELVLVDGVERRRFVRLHPTDPRAESEARSDDEDWTWDRIGLTAIFCWFCVLIAFLLLLRLGIIG